MENRIYKRREPGEQQRLQARLKINARPQADDGAIDELPDIKVETIKPEMFAILEDNKSVASQLTDLGPESVMAFGTADK